MSLFGRRTSDERSQHGSVTVVAAAIIIIGLVLAIGVVKVGGFVSERAHAAAAADAVALAAADELALGHGPLAAWLAAGIAAIENHVELVDCVCEGDQAKVEVALRSRFPVVGRIHAHARATVRRSSA